MSDLRIDVDVVDGWLQTIRVEGELDAYTAPQFMEAVTQTLDEGFSWLVVDLRQVEFIDSVGLGILIGGSKRAGEKNGDMAVACDRPNVRRVFEVSGTAELLNVVDELAHAVEILATERAARIGGQVCKPGGEAQ
ncbi:MAG: STAS domain-containing protein [Armatimonadetes bacterium]|nr:STAS domain-containing protein [Armatimonadota bacterium]